MTTLRIWTTLTPAERAEAIEKAKGIIAGGETRWHAIARLCGLSNSNGIRRAMDPKWRAQKNDADRRRMEASHRGVLAALLNTPSKAPITLPKLSFLEETTNGL